jgi:hypothetical protein
LGTLDPNSEVHDGSTWGVCKITLRETAYDWQFIPVAGGSFTDSGSNAVHAAPPVNHAPTITLSAPADGATGVALSPTLDAVPVDIDGDALDVTFYGRPAGGTVSPAGIVQDIGATANSNPGETTTVLSVAKTVSAGNTLVVGFGYYAAQGTETVTDNLGNTYTRIERSSFEGMTGSLWYAPVATGGALTTITATHLDSSYNVIQAVEIEAGTLALAGGGTSGSGTSATWAASRTIPADGLALGFTVTNTNFAHSAGAASGSPSTPVQLHRFFDGELAVSSSFAYAEAGATQVTGFTGTTLFAGLMNFAATGGIFNPASPWQLIGTDTNVASGDHATVTWSGLAPGTEYEWYATVSDGALGASSATRSFTTGAVVAGATYVSLTPARLLDTRVGNGLSGTFSSGVARTFTVTGRGGVPAGAVAVTGNLTVTGQTSPGFVALTPTPVNTPTTSTLNFPLGDNRANGVTVALSGTGTLSATYVGEGGPTATTELVFDVTGYFVP